MNAPPPANAAVFAQTAVVCPLSSIAILTTMNSGPATAATVPNHRCQLGHTIALPIKHAVALPKELPRLRA